MLEVWVAAQRIRNIVPTRSADPVTVKKHKLKHSPQRLTQFCQSVKPAGVSARLWQNWVSLQDCVWPVISNQIGMLTNQKVASKRRKASLLALIAQWWHKCTQLLSSFWSNTPVFWKKIALAPYPEASHTRSEGPWISKSGKAKTMSCESMLQYF